MKRDEPIRLPWHVRWRIVAERILVGIVLVSLVPAVMMMEGCRTIPTRPNKGQNETMVFMEVTGYDSGPNSCGWKRDWLGRPVYNYGPMKGKPKKVGITASGVRARQGTIAADTRYYPFGTVMYVPGYGYGRVEDRGGAIKGPGKIDLWFPSERAARQWGRRKQVRVTVWK